MKRLKIIEEGGETLNQFTKLADLAEYYKVDFDTIVADCEGFFEIFLLENLDYFDKINLILLEKDNPQFCNYFIIDEVLIGKGFYLNKDSKTHIVYSRNQVANVRKQEDVNYLMTEFRKFTYLDENNNRVNNIEHEVTEQFDAVTYIPINAKVLELGARYGTISCIINTIISDKTQMVVVEPDYSVIDCLKKNMLRNKCNFHIYNGIICTQNFNLIIESYATRLDRKSIPIDNVDKLIDISFHNQYTIPKSIKSKLVPVSNDYTLNVVNNNGDYNTNCFYIDENNIMIRIRRVDSIFGWDDNMLSISFINQFSENHEEFNIKVPKSDNPFIEFKSEIPFSVSKLDVNYESKIPKVIFQTSEDNALKSIYHINALYSMIEFNPEFEYKFFDNQDRREFIKKHYPERVLNAYDTLIPGSFKADLFKYAYLYIFGGCYMDNKFLARKSIRNIIKENNQVICQDPSYQTAYYTAVMYHEPGDKRFYECIDTIIHNISIKLMSFTLEVSGPMVQYKHFKNTPPNMMARIINPAPDIKKRYKDNVVEYKDVVYFNAFFKDYYFHNYTPYDRLFHNGLVYYSNYINNGESIIYTYPTEKKYNIIILDKTVVIKRVDENSGWNDDLVLHIINCNTNKHNDVYIGKSDSNSRILSFV